MVDMKDLKTKVRGVDVAFTAFNDCLNTEDLDGAHSNLIETMKALAALDEALWVYRNTPLEVGVSR